MLVLPGAAAAQESTMGGAIIDSTGGVLPGATVVAVHEATGNTFTTVTDGNGLFEFPCELAPIRCRSRCQASPRSRAQACSCSWASS